MSRRCNVPEVCELYGPDKWTDRSYKKLVALYRKSPCLWKKDVPTYLDSNRRHDAYNRIHKGMAMADVSFVEIMMKIREMRRVYVQELKKILEAEAIGGLYESCCPWFQDLHDFLYPYLDYEETAELHEVLDKIEHVSRDYSYDEQSERRAAPCPSFNVPDNFINGFSTADRTPKPGTCPVGRLQETHRASQTTEHTGTTNFTPGQSYYADDKYSRDCGQLPFDAYTTTSDSSCCTLVCDKSDLQSPTVIGGKEIPEGDYLGESILSDISAVDVSTDTAECNVETCDPSSKSIGRCDQFDVFGRSVACQLRKMDLNSALKAQTEIQKILTDLVVRPDSSAELSETIEASTTSRLTTVQDDTAKRAGLIISPVPRKRDGKGKKTKTGKVQTDQTFLSQPAQTSMKGEMTQFNATSTPRSSIIQSQRSSGQFVIPLFSVRKDKNTKSREPEDVNKTI